MSLELLVGRKWSSDGKEGRLKSRQLLEIDVAAGQDDSDAS
jgi:hypothetical protein